MRERKAGQRGSGAEMTNGHTVVVRPPFPTALLPTCPAAPPYSSAGDSSKSGLTGGMIGSSGYPMTATTMR